MPGDKGGKTKHDRCVEGVGSDVSNPHAVCVAAGVRPEKWKKGVKEKNDLVKALSDAGFRESALMLQNWDEVDEIAKSMEKTHIDEGMSAEEKIIAREKRNLRVPDTSHRKNYESKHHMSHPIGEGKVLRTPGPGQSGQPYQQVKGTPKVEKAKVDEAVSEPKKRQMRAERAGRHVIDVPKLDPRDPVESYGEYNPPTEKPTKLRIRKGDKDD